MSMNVLVAEKDPFVAAGVEKIIEELGHSVEQANTGEDALERCIRVEFAVSFLDIFLPDVQGGLLIPMLKRLQPQMGIVTMTDRNSRDLEWKIRQLGILYYMTKPVNSEELTSIVKHMSNKLGR